MMDLLLILLSAAAAAFGFWACLKFPARRRGIAWVAAALYLMVGMNAALVVTIGGTGQILPGMQLSPDLQAYWSGVQLDAGLFAPPHPIYLLLALAAHTLAVVAAPGRGTVFVLLPATLPLLGLYPYIEQRDPLEFGACSYDADTAYLTLSGNRLIFSVGPTEDLFVPVVHEHEAPSVPPRPRLAWSKDGELVTFTTLGGSPYFAFSKDGSTAGWLPTGHDGWPTFGKSPADSVAFQRKVSTARVEVSRLLEQHGGPAVQ